MVIQSNLSQKSKETKNSSPWKIRKGAIPKIPGLRRKDFKTGISKELDLVIEHSEVDTSPKKNSEEHLKIQVNGPSLLNGQILMVNSSTEFHNSNPQNGSEQDIINGPYADDHNFSPVNLELDVLQSHIVSPVR